MTLEVPRELWDIIIRANAECQNEQIKADLGIVIENVRLKARVAELEKEKAARSLRDFEKDHPGETRRILEKAWEIQQRTGKPVPFAQLADELNEAREREE